MSKHSKSKHALRFTGWALAIVLLSLVGSIFVKGAPRLNWEFLNSFPSRMADRAGVKSALLGSLWIMALTSLFSIPIGVGAAIYLNEFANATSRVVRFIQVNIANLAGVPSILYGILGLAIFVRSLSLGRSILSGAFTLALMALPAIIISTQEALRAVPKSLRLSALGLGATRWQTVRDHVLPAALPTICTGVLLSLSRVAGETAPLIMMGAMTYVAFSPASVFDSFTVLPVQIYNWASRPQEAFQENAAAAILVLLAVLMTLNVVALVIRARTQKVSFGKSR